MNIIQIVSDTFRRDFLGCYGNSWVHTEHLNRFAKESVVFDRAYIASFPTIPNRHDLFTGRYTFVYSMWSPLPKDEVILSQLLRQAGYTTMLIVDTYHMIRDAHYFDRGFDGWWWIRGQEHDRYMTNPTIDPPERKRALDSQYLRNVSQRRFEENYFVAQTMTAATKWLELNYDQHQKFFLHIDTFDPHEPWDPPQWYSDMYDPTWKGGDVAGGAYVSGVPRPTASDLTTEELNHLRALYAGEVTLVDRWIGKLLQKIEDLGLYENTAVIFTTDHGTYIGEHGYVGKRDHLYEEVAHIPLVVRTPDSLGVKPSRCEAIVQSPDLMPSILDLAGVSLPRTVQGRSVLPLLQDKETKEREIAVSAPSFVGREIPSWLTVTSKDWSLLAALTTKPADVHRKERVQSELYSLTKDPSQTRNLYDEKTSVADELRSKMAGFLRSLGAQDQVLSNWLST